MGGNLVRLMCGTPANEDEGVVTQSVATVDKDE